jgi:hypothetical protein
MKQLLTATLIALATATAPVMAEELLHPLSDEMISELGMTPIEEIDASKMKAPTSAQIAKLVEEHKVVMLINKSAKGPNAQTMTVFENGTEVLKTKVSTGKEERVTSASGRTYVSTTPNGFFRPTKMYTDYLSYTWNAPMPNAVFFVGGIAVHATGASNYSKLGSRASGGCVRTTLEDSKKIRELVMETGRGSAPGMYVVKKEAAGRNIITGNTVSVSSVDRNTGAKTGKLVQNWDTLIIVHE